MSSLIDLNSRRLRGYTALDDISKPYFGYVPDDGRVFGRRNSRLPLNRRFSNGAWNPHIDNVEIMGRENFSTSAGRNYRYQNPFAVGNSQTYQNPNFKSRYGNADFSFPEGGVSYPPGDGFQMREAVYGKPYGGFNPYGAGRNRIAGRSISMDQDVESYSTLAPARKGFNPFGFPQKRKEIIESYHSTDMMQSPYQKPVNALNLPTSERFSKLKQESNAFGVSVDDASISGQGRLWDEVQTQERNRQSLQPEMFSPQTNKNDQVVLVNLLVLTFILLLLTMLR